MRMFFDRVILLLKVSCRVPPSLLVELTAYDMQKFRMDFDYCLGWISNAYVTEPT